MRNNMGELMSLGTPQTNKVKKQKEKVNNLDAILKYFTGGRLLHNFINTLIRDLNGIVFLIAKQ